MTTNLLATSALAALSLAALACNGDNGRAPSPTTTEPAAPSPGTSTAAESPARGTWRTLAPMPTPRSEVAVAELGGKIYVIGGFEEDGSPSTKVEVYDPASDAWAEAAPLPEPRHHAAAAALNGVLYVVGGYETSFSDAQSTIFAFPIGEAGTWVERGAGLRNPRGGHALAVLDGKLYAAGGAGPDGRNVAAVEAYDPSTTEWTEVAPLPTPRDHLAVAVSLDGKIYAIGGRLQIDFGRNVDANEEYDPRSDEWMTKAPLPTARSGIAAAALDGRIYVFGGEGSGGTFDENEAYDPETDTWEGMPPMPTARHGLGAVAVGETMYVIGGGPTPGLSVSGANEAFTP